MKKENNVIDLPTPFKELRQELIRLSAKDSIKTLFRLTYVNLIISGIILLFSAYSLYIVVKPTRIKIKYAGGYTKVQCVEYDELSEK